MPFVELASGFKLWKGEIPDAKAHYERISGLRMFPSANYRSKAIETIANITPGDDPELKVDSPTKSDKPKP